MTPQDSPVSPRLDPGETGPEHRPELPPQRRPGYAPKLCLRGPAHYARRDVTITDRMVWRCLTCGRAWTTTGEEVE